MNSADGRIAVAPATSIAVAEALKPAIWSSCMAEWVWPDEGMKGCE